MNIKIVLAIIVWLVAGSVSSSAIPIWEMLTYEEKMGKLMYTYVHLVERYCKVSPSKDCRKIMTLHGISNLLNYDEHTLDLLDPDQRNGGRLVWQAATKSQYKYPSEKYDQETIKSAPNHQYETSESRDEPRKIYVPAPKFFRRVNWQH
ncbi:rhythmically expressed gene 5 protein-like [Uloborus diversus]|uniref:rhythmically expressed gene 5 protein-like n=1 Tax=Uloborus diversus TaxID=327109 RepID=UPI00240A6271|nr:rhythmically expressed gene 5 protein-like [Uloborus diversus]XP_054723821.1 rhythmically expressed gene 5 protein-like [Uloborus diversus]